MINLRYWDRKRIKRILPENLVKREIGDRVFQQSIPRGSFLWAKIGWEGFLLLIG